MCSSTRMRVVFRFSVCVCSHCKYNLINSSFVQYDFIARCNAVQASTAKRVGGLRGVKRTNRNYTKWRSCGVASVESEINFCLFSTLKRGKRAVIALRRVLGLKLRNLVRTSDHRYPRHKGAGRVPAVCATWRPTQPS